ncbi:MAG: hypothetical protein JRM89_03290 [Nitrososphaerota archaeon]|jgi:hypothetical protein|nr:hypothetical protein [Nitrososphaerota archaeon]MDG6960234.1 hypothetical protein [Nitrososphaerota archaeon]MDG6964996.1 hypothetical protein [Nitrososphaerota archaeon]MDG7014995.1 hypothetical protein [Nitrososphaerota archaeon]WGO50950.1 MAG: hypothetical protein JRM93_02755 [Nitrososphaerota archaeon]
MSVRLSLGHPPSFVARMLALASLVALLAGSLALDSLVTEAVPPVGGAGALLVSSFLGEVGTLLSAWLVPVWALTAAAAFVVSAGYAREFAGSGRLLSDLGAPPSATARLLALRTLLLGALSLALGVSLGVVAAQVVFRAAVVLAGAPYYVPELTPASLGTTAALALSAVLLGGAGAGLSSRTWRGP